MASPGFLVGLIHQRLMPVLCDRCAIPLDLATFSSFAWGHLQHAIENTITLKKDLPHLRQRGEGCVHCRHTGYAHRTVVAGVVTAQEGSLHSRHRVGKPWPLSMPTHALEKVRAGLLDVRDVHTLLWHLDRPGPPVG